MPLLFSWDHNFKAIMTGDGSSPSSSIKRSHADREKLFSILSRYLKDHLADTASVIRLQVDKVIALGLPWEFAVRTVALRLLWAGTANTTPVAVWAAAFVFNNPGLTLKLRDELANADLSVPLDQRSPSAQFVAEETNRLVVFGNIVRPVLARDTLLPTSEGEQLHVRKGDLVLGQAREIHRIAFDQPDKFVFDRIEKARRAGKTNIGYIPFGGGRHIVKMDFSQFQFH
jgi:hypothetical protein